MSETPILVVIEVVSVHDPVGLKAYQERSRALIGSLGGSVIGHGGTPVDGVPGFAPLAIQRWPSERAFRAWLASDAYQPLLQLRRASATMRAAIIQVHE